MSAYQPEPQPTDHHDKTTSRFTALAAGCASLLVVLLCVGLAGLGWYFFIYPTTPTYLSGKAAVEINAGQYDEGVATYRQILARDPKNQDALEGLSLTAVHMEQIGDLDRAIEIYRIVRQHDPDRPAVQDNLSRALLARAEQSRANNELDAAMQDLSAVLDIVPNHPQANTQLGDIYQQRQDYEASIGYYQKALESDAGVASARLGLGWAYYYTNQFEQALSEFISLENTYPIDAVKGQGLSYLGMQQYNNALPFLQDWARAEPDAAEAHAAVGQAAKETGNANLAISSYRAALSIKERAGWYNDLGALLSAEGQHEAALEAYQKSRDLDPEQVAAYRLAGWIYLQHFSNHDEKAASLFERAAFYAERRSLSASDLGIYTGLATAHRRLGQHRQAIDALDIALQLSPNSVLANRLMAQSYHSLEDYETAIVYYEHLIQLEERADYLSGLGHAHRLSSNCEKAIPVYERALVLQPDHRGARDGLEMCLPQP